jgi:hypothetical protein
MIRIAAIVLPYGGPAMVQTIASPVRCVTRPPGGSHLQRLHTPFLEAQRGTRRKPQQRPSIPFVPLKREVTRGCPCTDRLPFAAMTAIGSSVATDSSSVRHKRIAFDAAVLQALHRLSLDSAKSVQQLADEAFRDLLKKHRRPITLSEALKESLRMQPANDQPTATVHRLRRRP